MSRDEIAQAMQDTAVNSWGDEAHFQRFAALVIAAEREAIAKMIEDAPELVPLAKNDQGGCVICGFNPKFAAAFIRARGNT